MAKKKGDENPETENTGNGEQKTERKKREVKVKHAEGSPHDVLQKFVETLSPTQADYLNRHVIKKAFKEEHADPTGFEGELYNSIKEKLA